MLQSSKEAAGTTYTPMQVATYDPDTFRTPSKTVSTDRYLHPSRGGTAFEPPTSNRGVQCELLAGGKSRKPTTSFCEAGCVTTPRLSKGRFVSLGIQHPPPADVSLFRSDSVLQTDESFLQAAAQLSDDEENERKRRLRREGLVDQITQTYDVAIFDAATQTVDSGQLHNALQQKYDDLFERYKMERNLRVVEKAKLEARVAALEKQLRAGRGAAHDDRSASPFEESLRILISAPMVSVQFGMKNAVDVRGKFPLALIEAAVREEVLPEYTKILIVRVTETGQKMVGDETVEEHVGKMCNKIVSHITNKVEKIVPVAKVTTTL